MGLEATFVGKRINRATYSVLLGVYAALFALAVMLQLRVPGEVLLAFICVPRLHDLGKSGWWFGLALLLASAVAVAFWFATKSEDAAILAAMVALLIPVVTLAFIGGQQGANRFGALPAAGVGFTRAVQRP